MKEQPVGVEPGQEKLEIPVTPGLTGGGGGGVWGTAKPKPLGMSGYWDTGTCGAGLTHLRERCQPEHSIPVPGQGPEEGQGEGRPAHLSRPDSLSCLVLFWSSGDGATAHLETGGFIRSRPGVPHPDIQFHFLPSQVIDHGRVPTQQEAYQVSGQQSPYCSRALGGEPKELVFCPPAAQWVLVGKGEEEPGIFPRPCQERCEAVHVVGGKVRPASAQGRCFRDPDCWKRTEVASSLGFPALKKLKTVR